MQNNNNNPLSAVLSLSEHPHNPWRVPTKDPINLWALLLKKFIIFFYPSNVPHIFPHSVKSGHEPLRLKKKKKKKKLEIEALTSHMRESDSVRRRNNTLDEEEQQRRQKRKTNLISDAQSQIQSKVQSSVKEG